MCKPKILFFLPYIVIALISIFFPRITNANKPTLPLAIETRLLNNPNTEGIAKIKMTLIPSVDIPIVSVYCKPPQGAGLSKGEEKWEVSLEKDKSEEIFYSIPVSSDKYYEIEFAVTMTLDKIKGTIYSFVEINPLIKKNIKKKLKTKSLPDGKKVIEFKGE